MEVSRNDTLNLIRKCMKEVKKRENEAEVQGQTKTIAYYNELGYNGSMDYMAAIKMQDNTAELAQIFQKYQKLERELFKMARKDTNPVNSEKANTNPVNFEKAKNPKFVVISVMDNTLSLANDTLSLVEKDSKEYLYLNAVINEIEKDFMAIDTLDEEDIVLDTYFSKYTNIYTNIKRINSENRKVAQDKKTKVANSGIGTGAFQASRNAPRYTKEDVEGLINDCRIKLNSLNDNDLIALEDVPTFEALIDEISADFAELENLDPRDKKEIEVYYKKYVLIQKDINRLVEDLTSKDKDNKDKNVTKNNDIITKKRIIEKLNKAIKTIDEALNNKRLRRKTHNSLIDLAEEMESLGKEVNTYDEIKDQDKLKAADKKADRLIDKLSTYKLGKNKIKGKIKEKDQSEKTIKDRELFNGNLKTIIASVGGTLAGLALVTFLILNLKSCSTDKLDDKNNDLDIDNRPGYEQTTSSITANNIDIENYEELMSLAMDIQGKLDPTTPLSIEDIMYSIRLANFDNLNDKAIFRERDEVCASTYNMGAIAKSVGINSIVQKDTSADIYLPDETMLDITMCATDLNITRDDFAEAKTEKGYDIYTVCQICLDNMYGTDPDKAFYFCRIFNDITARLHQDFSIIPDCPISTRYVLAGMYTGNADKILELTAGQVLGPIYGSGYRIDGTYGNMCVEELEAFMRINRGEGEAVGNENNLLYADIIDDNITSYFAPGL